MCVCVRERKAPGYDNNRGAERREKARDRKERYEIKRVRRREIWEKKIEVGKKA